MDRLTKDSRHDHFWIESGHLHETYTTIRGHRYRYLCDVDYPDTEKLTDQDIKAIDFQLIIKSPIRALSWKQPFASLMLHGKVETRSWDTKYRGWVLICASAAPYSVGKMEEIAGRRNASINETLSLEPKELIRGHAIAIGYLYSSQPMENFLMPESMYRKSLIEKACFVQYNPELFCHSYSEVQAIEPFEWKGSQGWKTIDNQTKAKIKLLQL